MKKKAQVRSEIIASLKQFTTRQTADTNLHEKLQSTPEYQAARIIAAYWPLDFEHDPRSLFNDTSKIWLLPRCLPERQLAFLPYLGPNHLKKSTFGLLEPDSGENTQPDLILVPGLAFNPQNYRIGFGGGYYDRYLADFKGHTLSLAYHFQIIDFPQEPHDIPLERVITP
ncbi:MAG: 5-formyltetrahydrofolate cyclo-ligase [Streptococcaceae bacterium]|jgi:5-formyltetrahydrofolate cyclo-ligase|nr:5-formyltetrahydrofolate cyclo-ligase [Streptococcaceae bacterium]